MYCVLVVVTVIPILDFLYVCFYVNIELTMHNIYVYAPCFIHGSMLIVKYIIYIIHVSSITLAVQDCMYGSILYIWYMFSHQEAMTMHVYLSTI